MSPSRVIKSDSDIPEDFAVIDSQIYEIGEAGIHITQHVCGPGDMCDYTCKKELLYRLTPKPLARSDV